MTRPDQEKLPAGLRKLWLEVTAGCNLRCLHCYADSGPSEYSRDQLTGYDYQKLLGEAHDFGCSSVQFIGGEPMHSRVLPDLVEQAHHIGYKNIEIFTNATILPHEALAAIQKYNAKLAISFYSEDAHLHDEITQVTGSFRRTVANIRKLVEHRVPIRCAIILLSRNATHVEKIEHFLKRLGVQEIGVDRMRNIGRARQLDPSTCDEFEELCHNCWKGLAVSSEGEVYPCVMARAFPVGNLHSSSLEKIIFGKELADFRDLSYSEYLRISGRYDGRTCRPYECGPDEPDCGKMCKPDGW